MGELAKVPGEVPDAVSKLTEAGVKVSDAVLEWKKFNMDIAEGGTEVKFPAQTKAMMTPDEIQKALSDKFADDLKKDGYKLSVSMKRSAPQTHLIGLRMIKTDNKLAFKLSWRYAWAEVKVLDKGGTVVHQDWFGQFIDGPSCQVSQTHIGKTGYFYEIDGSGSTYTISPQDGMPTSEVTVAFELGTSLKKRTISGGKDAKDTSSAPTKHHSLKYVISGTGAVEFTSGNIDSQAPEGTSVPWFLDDEGTKIDPDAVDHLTRDQVLKMAEMATSSNQGKLFSLPKNTAKPGKVTNRTRMFVMQYQHYEGSGEKPRLIGDPIMLVAIGMENTALIQFINWKKNKTHAGRAFEAGIAYNDNKWELYDVPKDMRDTVRDYMKETFGLGYGEATGKSFKFYDS